MNVSFETAVSDFQNFENYKKMKIITKNMIFKNFKANFRIKKKRNICVRTLLGVCVQNFK